MPTALRSTFRLLSVNTVRLFIHVHVFCVRVLPDRCDPCPAHLREFFLEDPVNDKLHFEMLVQGQVKRNTQGTVYFGLEIPGERLGLSFFFQGVLSVLLKVGASVIPGLHYDWGSKDASDEDAQAPHCVFPLSTLQQKLIITPQSHCAPPMGAKSFPMFIHNTPLSPRMQLTVDNVYSFSIRSKSLDFASWKAVDVRGFGDFDLQSVWGDRPLQFVAYELEDGANNHLHSARAGQSEGDTGAEEEAPTVEHRRKLKKYLFRIDVSKDTLFQKNESQKCR